MNSLFSKLKFLIHFLLLKVLYFASIGKRIADRRKWAVIVRTDHLGDLLCSVSFIEQLTGYYHEQGLSVAILVEPAYIELAMRICPCDRVIGIDPEKTVNIRYRTRIMRKLYAMNIRVLLGMVVPNQAYFIELFSFAREKHLFFQPVLFRQKNLLWLTRHYEYRHDILPGICMQDQYVRIFHEITGRTVSHRPLDLRRLLPEVRAKQMFRKKYYLLLPGASGPKKCWPFDRFAELVNRLRKDFPEYDAVIAGASAYDRDMESLLLAEIGDLSKIHSVCGKTSLKDFFAWISGAAFVIGNDSGGIHAAAAFQIPSFSVIFGTEFGRFLPNPYYLLNHSFYSGKDCLRCLGECVFPKADNQPFPCLLDVSVDEVYRAIRAFLTAEGNA